MNKKHASGAEKRKRKSDIQAHVAKLPRINTFFGYVSEISSSQEVEQHDPEKVQDVISHPANSNGQTETLNDDEPPVPMSTLFDIRPPSTDPALWNSDSQLIEYWVRCGPQTCSNRDRIYSNSERQICGKKR